MKRRQIRWIHLLLLASIAANLILLAGVLYLRVPAVHSALLPMWRAMRTIVVPASPLAEQDSITNVGPPRQLVDGELFLSLREDKTEASLFLPPISVDEMYVIRFDDSRVVALEPEESSFAWELHDGGSQKNPNQAMVYIQTSDGLERFIGEIGIYRFSEIEALEHLNTVRENGWVFLGRCTFDLVREECETCVIREESATLESLTRTERVELRDLFPSLIREGQAYVSLADLVDALSELSASMCALGVRNISASNNAAIYNESPSNAILGVVDGRIGVQCQGLRSVFAWVAISTGWLDVTDIREVDLFRYVPIDGVDVNSHAILELRLRDGEWMAFDPLWQAVFTDSAHEFLSVEDIRYLRNNGELNEIEVLPIGQFCVSSTLPYYAGEEGGFWNGIDFSDRDPFNYNYWSHFERIIYRYLLLPSE